MKKNDTGKALLYAVPAVLFWSTSPTAFKLGLRFLDPLSLLAFASATSLVVLGVALLPGKRYREIAGFSARDFLFSFLLGLLNPVVYYLVLFKAYSLLPAQIAQPLNMIWPVVLVLLSVPLLGQKIGWKSIIAMCISFAGVVVLSLQGGKAEGDPGNRLGISLALSTSVIWSVYWIFNAKDRRDPVARLFLNFLFATLMLMIAVLPGGRIFTSPAEGILSGVYVGIFEMGITFVFWRRAMQYATANDRIGNLVYIAPFLNLLIVRLVLGEKIFWTTVFGILLLVSGILIQNLVSRHAQRER